MLTIDQAIENILADCKPVNNSISATLIDSLHHVLAEDPITTIDMPPFNNSAMDGFAVNTCNLKEGPYQLPISQTIMAGHPASPLADNSAARIFTGAMLPEGADAVIIQENCKYDENQVSFSQRPEAFENIRKQGEDVTINTGLLNKGKRLSAQDISLLASGGVSLVQVKPKLKVAIISTGDELVMPPKALNSAQIYNSNYFLLQGLLTQFHANIIDIGNIKDDSQAIKKALLTASQYDLIITTGGVSVGAGDLLKQVVSELGGIDLWKVAIKPGKPIAFGQVAGTPCFGLPGNPVSAFITFLLFVRPYLKKCKVKPSSL